VGRWDAVVLGGQRFPQRGRSLTARALSRYFLDEGTTTYTHLSDQHSTYGTTVIPTTWREAVAVLDDIFGNPTDLPIAEHTTDTAGQTLATFAIFNLAGLQFSPRASATLDGYSSTASAQAHRGEPATRTPERCSPSPSKPS